MTGPFATAMPGGPGPTLVLVGADVVTPDAVLPGAWVAIADGLIAGVGPPEPGTGRPPAEVAQRAAELGAPVIDLVGRRLLPGLVDLHVHGGGGAGFDLPAPGRSGSDDPSGAPMAGAVPQALAAHRSHGTTRTLVSLVTGSPSLMVSSIRRVVEAVADDPSVLGIHLEGPFLAAAQRGVHDPAALLDPDPAVLDQFLTAGDGLISVVTIAPERPGAPDLIRRLVEAGVHAAVGHSDADYDQARRAFDEGADLVTHTFNGMRPLHHRDPGIVGAAVDSAGVILEVINDGVHVHPAAVRLLAAAAPGRIALITDAMEAAAHHDGAFALGGRPVTVSGGVARLTGTEVLAGSTLTLDRAVQRAVREVGMSLSAAVNAASLTPARLLGADDRYGSITPGRVADLVVTDQDGAVVAVMIAGEWADSRRP